MTGLLPPPPSCGWRSGWGASARAGARVEREGFCHDGIVARLVGSVAVRLHGTGGGGERTDWGGVRIFIGFCHLEGVVVAGGCFISRGGAWGGAGGLAGVAAGGGGFFDRVARDGGRWL
jgi:hypothetical protein